MNINGNWMNFAYMDNPTLYTSAYLVASPQGYTKHYYAGSERIASCIGQGGLSIIDQPLTIVSNENWIIKKNILHHQMGTVFGDCLNKMFDENENGLYNLYGLTEAHTAIMEQYFYHPDHLGSTSWITDGSGNAIQYMHYLPYGEEWIDQQSTSWNAPYTFTGKIKDAETGYNYFGARYYDRKLSVWLSVDPLSDKYPSLSPYTYCANNPIMMVDPDGRFFVSKADKVIADLFSLKLDVTTKLVTSLLKINPDNSELKDRLKELKAAKKEFIELKNAKNIGISFKEYKDQENATTEYSEFKNGVHYINITGPNFGEDIYGFFAHELKHVYQFKKGELSFGKNKGAGEMYDYYDEYDAFKRSAAISGIDFCMFLERLDTDPDYEYARSQMYRKTVNQKWYKYLDNNEEKYIKQK